MSRGREGGCQSHQGGRARTQVRVRTPGPTPPTHPHPQAGSHSRPCWDTGPFSPPASLAKGPMENGRVKATHQNNREKLLLSCPAHTDNRPASLAKIQRQDKGSGWPPPKMTFTDLPGKDIAKSKARVPFPGRAARETRPKFLSQLEPQPRGHERKGNLSNPQSPRLQKGWLMGSGSGYHLQQVMSQTQSLTDPIVNARSI